MKEFFSIIFMNIFGFDAIIFVVAAANAVIYNLTKKSADELYKKMHLTIFVPAGESSAKEADDELERLRESDVAAMRKRTGKLYSTFINITGIFPLLGILGTVISLLGLVDDMANIQGNFYGALTSTFWGLVFAIIFKLLDSGLSAKIEDNEKTVALYLDRNSSGIKPAEKSEEHYGL